MFFSAVPAKAGTHLSAGRSADGVPAFAGTATLGKLLPPRTAQVAGRADGAAVAPFVPFAAVALIAAVGLLADQLDERLAARAATSRVGGPDPAGRAIPGNLAAMRRGCDRGTRAPPGGAGRNRSRSSRPRRSGRAPRPGRWSNPARRKTARARHRRSSS